MCQSVGAQVGGLFFGKQFIILFKIYPLKLYFKDTMVNITTISRLASLANPPPPKKRGKFVPKMAQNGRL